MRNLRGGLVLMLMNEGRYFVWWGGGSGGGSDGGGGGRGNVLF